MSVAEAPSASSHVRNLDMDTCCPEEAELIPCSACYEKHHREKQSAAADPSLALLLAPPPEPPLGDLAASTASLQRVPPPDIPHGHAASAPEDITHHQAHARQIPGPSPPDSSGQDDGVGAMKQPQDAAAETHASAGERSKDKETGDAPPSTSPAPSLPSAAYSSGQTQAGGTSASPLYLPASGDQASAGGRAHSEYGNGSIESSSSSYYAAPHSLYGGSPLPRYEPAAQYYDLASLAQQTDMYYPAGNFNHIQQHQQQQQASHHSPLPAYMLPQPSAVYGGAPIAMVGPSSGLGTYVYFPSGPPSVISASPQTQPQMSQMQQQHTAMAPPGFVSYYQQAAQPSRVVQIGSQQQQMAVSMQQPVAFVNGIPCYLTPAAPSPAVAAEQAAAVSYAPQLPRHPPADSSSVHCGPSSTASTISSLSSVSSSASSRLQSSVSGSTYKTEICRSHQYSGSCMYGPTCQFAHGLDDLRTREVEAKFKTERCKNFHQYGPASCFYAGRCRFIHDEFRVRVGTHEFWLVSPRENMVRVEKVDPANSARLSQLNQLIAEQSEQSQRAAEELLQQMNDVNQQQHAVECACEQLQGVSLQERCAGHHKDEAAARFLKKLVSPHQGGLNGSPAPINVQAMQVQHSGFPSIHRAGRSALSSFFHAQSPSRVSYSSTPPLYSSLPSGPPHQQSGASVYNNGNPSAAAAVYPSHASPPPNRGAVALVEPPSPYSPTPLSVLSQLLTPQALQSLLALNVNPAALGRFAGSLDEPKKRRRARKKRKPRSCTARDDGSTCSELAELEHDPAQQSDDEDPAAADIEEQETETAHDTAHDTHPRHSEDAQAAAVP